MDIARGVGVVAGWTMIAQIIMVLASPIVSRLYTPTDFGIFAVYAGLATILSIIGCGNYDFAIPYAKNVETERSLVFLCVIILPLTTALVTIFMMVEGERIFKWFNVLFKTEYVWAIPSTMFVLCCFSITQHLALRKKNYLQYAQGNVVQSVATVVFQVGFGMVVFPSGLILGYFLGRLSAAIFAVSAAIGLSQICYERSDLKIKQVAARYKKFPVFLTWSSIFHHVSSEILVFTMAAFFQPATAGLVSLSQRVLQLPAIVLTNAVGKVFISLAQDAKRAGMLTSITETVVKTLAIIAIPCFSIIGLVAPNAFSLIFGPSWHMAGVYAQCLLPWITIMFIAAPLSAVLTTLQKQEYELFFQIILFVVRIASVVAGIINDDPLLAITLFGATSAACWLVFVFATMSLAGHRAIDVFWWLLKEFVVAVPFLALIAAIKFSIAEPVSDLVIVLTALSVSLALAALTGVRLIGMHKQATYQVDLK